MGPLCPRARRHDVARRRVRSGPVAGRARRPGRVCWATAPRARRRGCVPGHGGGGRALCRRQRGDVRHFRRLPHLSPAHARRRPAHGPLVGDAAPHARGRQRPGAVAGRLSGRLDGVTPHQAPAHPAHVRRMAASACLLAAWAGAGQYAYNREWTTRQDRRIAENSHWVLASSIARAAVRDDTVRLSEGFGDADLGDFAPPAPPTRDAVARAVLVGPRGARATRASARNPARPPNVILSCSSRSPRGGPAWQRALRHDAHPDRRAGTRLSSTTSTHTSGAAPTRWRRCCSPRIRSSTFSDVTEQYPALGRHVARLHVPRPRLSDVVRDAERPEWAGWKHVPRRRGFDACATTAT